mmetsp:Transcript_34729/g.42699  ORF Transcript_34729/g.42699 Transcript_34729/m.42699 type:complete len:92 (+) Transcript_34729:160-435(+)
MAGEIIGLNVKGFNFRIDLKWGDIVFNPDCEPMMQDTLRFTAQVMVMISPIKIKKGFEAILFCSTANVPCRLQAVIAKLDKTGKPSAEKPA